MEHKRELSSVDLTALVGELSGYEGAILDKAYLYGDDLLRLKLRHFERGRVELLIEVGEIKRLHAMAPERVPDAPERPPEFAMKLRSHLEGATLEGVEQFEFDRIVSLQFERDDGHTTVVAELFGDGNVAILDANRKVLACLETVRLKSRTVAPGSQYDFPASRVHPLEIDRESFLAQMDESTTDVVRTLATQLNFGGFWGEELCTRAGVEKALPIEDATEAEYEAVYDAVRGLADRLREGNLDPRIYYEDDRPVDATPVPIQEYERLQEEPADSFNAALDEYFFELEREPDEEAAEPDRPAFEAEIEKRERIIAQQEGAIEEFEAQAERERERAERLYASYDLVDEVLSTVREAREQGRPWDEIETTLAEGAAQGIPAAEAVVDVDGSEGTVTVALGEDRGDGADGDGGDGADGDGGDGADGDGGDGADGGESEGLAVELDPSVGVEHNADRLYTEAKRVEEKREGALSAIDNTREELAEWERRKERWEAGEHGTVGDEDGEGGDEEAAEDERERDWLTMGSVPVRKDEQWYERFRWFHTSEGFLVIGGRDADQNEELVKKYLERGDRFFHAQAHGGPATILKATGPSEAAKEVDFPESSLQQAAQFAVSYSSVWKDGRFAGDVYAVEHDQVTKTPESGEFLEKGGFAIRGDRTYYDDTPVGVAVGIQCEPTTLVVGGPPAAVEATAETTVRIEPGRYAQADAAKRIYRTFRERFADTSLVRKVASPDLIQHFMPPGGSRIVEE